MSYSVFVQSAEPLMFLGSEKIALLKHVAWSDYNARLTAGIMHMTYPGPGWGENYEYKVITEGTYMFSLPW